MRQLGVHQGLAPVLDVVREVVKSLRSDGITPEELARGKGQVRGGLVLGLEDSEKVAILLTFGRPAKPRDPARRSPEDWLERADRRPFDDVVREVD